MRGIWARLQLSLVAGVLCSAPVSLSQAQTRASDAVYELVSSTNTAEVQGRAVLLDDTNGIFLTAGHLAIDSTKTVLKRNNVLLKFKVVLQGNDVLNVIDDWSVLRAVDENWSESLPLPTMNPVYEFPASTEIKDVAVLAGDRRVIFPSTAELQSQNFSTSCTPASAGLVELTRYDHGDSGSPLYLSSERRSGIIAITSRFQNEYDDLSNDEKAIVRAYYQYLEASRAGKEKPGDQVLRRMVRDKVLVKFVPTKCIIDSLIMNMGSEFTYGQDDRLLSRFSTLAGKMKRGIGSDEDQARMSDLLSVIVKTNLSWLQMLQLWKVYFEIYGSANFGDPAALSLLFALEDAGRRSQLSGLYQAFAQRIKIDSQGKTQGGSESNSRRAALYQGIGRWAEARAAHVAFTKQTLVAEFVSLNSDWHKGTGKLRFPTLDDTFFDPSMQRFLLSSANRLLRSDSKMPAAVRSHSKDFALTLAGLPDQREDQVLWTLNFVLQPTSTSDRAQRDLYRKVQGAWRESFKPDARADSPNVAALPPPRSGVAVGMSPPELAMNPGSTEPGWTASFGLEPMTPASERSGSFIALPSRGPYPSPRPTR